MKRKISWENESSDSEDEESEDEPAIQSVLDDLSDGVSRQEAKDLLHTMAASKNILFWTSGGELLRNQRRIPETSMAELIEYVLLPYDQEISEPKGITSFLDGMAELGINKRDIKNKVALSDLIQKESEIEDTSDDEDEEPEEEGNGEDSDEESGQEEEKQHGEGIEESGPQNEDKCTHCASLDVDVDFGITCPKCFWHDYFVMDHPRSPNDRMECVICNHNFLLRKAWENVLFKCNNCNELVSVNNNNTENEN